MNGLVGEDISITLCCIECRKTEPEDRSLRSEHNRISIFVTISGRMVVVCDRHRRIMWSRKKMFTQSEIAEMREEEK